MSKESTEKNGLVNGYHLSNEPNEHCHEVEERAVHLKHNVSSKKVHIDCIKQVADDTPFINQLVRQQTANRN